MYDLFYVLDRNGNSVVPNTEAGRTAYLQAAERRNTNWFNKLFQTSIMQNHTLSFSSGTEKSTYYASLSALFDPGWTKGRGQVTEGIAHGNGCIYNLCLRT